MPIQHFPAKAHSHGESKKVFCSLTGSRSRTQPWGQGKPASVGISPLGLRKQTPNPLKGGFLRFVWKSLFNLT